MAGGGRTALQSCQNGCRCAQLPQKSSCDTLLAAEVCSVNGDLTTGPVAHPHAKEDEVAESVFPNVIFYFFLKVELFQTYENYRFSCY